MQTDSPQHPHRSRYTAAIRYLGRAALLAIALAAAGAPARAQDGTIITLQFDNDLFLGSTDRHYTHGTRLAYLSPRRAEDGTATSLARWLPCIDCDGEVRYGVAIGQSIFTPDDITQFGLIRDDRPFAGWLYATFSLVRGPAASGAAQSPEAGDRRDRIDHLDSFKLTLGVVGPSSAADKIQTANHGVFRDYGARDANGWDNQLEDEPGIVLSYDSRWRWPLASLTDDIGINMLPTLGVSLGNVFTYAAAGVTFRIGGDLANDFGPPRIRPSLAGSDYYVPANGLGWYFFAGAGARAVARNIFLDGNTFQDSHSVDKEPFVVDLQAGLVLSLWRRARVAFTAVFRTPEFERQDEGDAFGTITVSHRF